MGLKDKNGQYTPNKEERIDNNKNDKKTKIFL